MARFEATFRAPRTPFPSSAITTAVQGWTERIEKEYGHSLDVWKVRGSTKTRWRSTCRKCGMDFEVGLVGRERPLFPLFQSSEAFIEPENPSLWKETSGICPPAKPQELVRGVGIDVGEPLTTFLAKSPSEIASKVISILTSHGGLGEAWTSPSHVTVAQAYAKNLTHGRKEGVHLPVVMHAEFWLEDQRRGYKPGGPFMGFVEWIEGAEGMARDEEIPLQAHEIVRLQSIEWWDGTQWVSHSAGGVKAKT